MSVFDYTENIPSAPHNPSADQPSMQINTNSISNLIDVDHVGFNASNGGYHTIIHQITQIAPPANIPGINQVFSMVPTYPVGGDTQLFTLTGNNGLSQMTGHHAASSGFVWCAGILLQWGTFDPTSSVNVLFPITFPTAVFNLQLTGSASDNGTYRAGLSTGSLMQSGFTFQGTIDSHWKPIYFFAIGN